MSVKIVKMSNLEIQMTESEDTQESLSATLFESVVEKFKSGEDLTQEERTLLLSKILREAGNGNCGGC